MISRTTVIAAVKVPRGDLMIPSDTASLDAAPTYSIDVVAPVGSVIIVRRSGSFDIFFAQVGGSQFMGETTP